MYFLLLVSSNPQNVSASKVTSNSITLEWAPPLNPNGVIKYYDVCIHTKEIDRENLTFLHFASHMDVVYFIYYIYELCKQKIFVSAYIDSSREIISRTHLREIEHQR